jgi:hypothetical protein
MIRQITIFIGALLLVCMLCVSCKDRVPGQYPNKSIMVDILTDLHLAEATISHEKPVDKPKGGDYRGYYKTVLDKYGLTKNQFDSALAWYTAHPSIYLKVYDDVIARLSNLEAQSMVDLSKLEEREKVLAELMATRQLWNDTTTFLFPYSENADTRFPFKVDVDSLRLGELRLNAFYKFKKNDKTAKYYLMLIACYSDSTVDSVKTEIVRSFDGINTQVIKALLVDKSLVSINGFLLHHDEGVKPKVDIDKIQLEYIPSQNINDYPE